MSPNALHGMACRPHQKTTVPRGSLVHLHERLYEQFADFAEDANVSHVYGSLVDAIDDVHGQELLNTALSPSVHHHNLPAYPVSTAEAEIVLPMTFISHLRAESIEQEVSASPRHAVFQRLWKTAITS